jgi:hypothetical protein
MKAALLLLAALFAPVAAWSAEGPGAYALVCRDAGGRVASAKLLDLVEAERRGIVLDAKPRNLEEYLKLAAKRLQKVAKFHHYNFQLELFFELDGLFRDKRGLEAGRQLTAGKPETEVQPEPGCGWEPLSNAARGGALIENPELVPALPPVHLAGYYLHEAAARVYSTHVGGTGHAMASALVANLLAKKESKDELRSLTNLDVDVRGEPSGYQSGLASADPMLSAPLRLRLSFRAVPRSAFGGLCIKVQAYLYRKGATTAEEAQFFFPDKSKYCDGWPLSFFEELEVPVPASELSVVIFDVLTASPFAVHDLKLRADLLQGDQVISSPPLIFSQRGTGSVAIIGGEFRLR